MARRKRFEETPDAPVVAAQSGPVVVKVDARTFAAQPPIVNGVTTIDGYIFVGFPYYSTTDDLGAVNIWLKLLEDPNYASLPPVTSISVDSTVGGDVPPQP